MSTLKELDESGLHIGTSSGSLRNLFGVEDRESDLMKSLASKFDVLNTTETVIKRTAEKRDICCIERKTDLSIIMTVSSILC